MAINIDDRAHLGTARAGSAGRLRTTLCDAGNAGTTPLAGLRAAAIMSDEKCSVTFCAFDQPGATPRRAPQVQPRRGSLRLSGSQAAGSVDVADQQHVWRMGNSRGSFRGPPRYGARRPPQYHASCFAIGGSAANSGAR